MNNDTDTCYRAEQLLSILQSSATGYFLVDQQCRVLLFNQAAPALYKKVTGRVLYEGLDFVSLLIEERKNVVAKAVDMAFSGEVTEYEVKYTQPSAGWIKVRYAPAYNAARQCTGVCITIEDITGKKGLEETAHRRELKFLSLFNYSGIGMTLVSPAGKLLDVNPAFVQLTGYSQEELLQCSFQDITHPADLGQDLEFVQRMLAGELETYQFEKRYHHKNGGIIWVFLTVSLVRKADGTPDFFIGQVVDITAAKAMIRELEAKNNALDFTAHHLEQKIQQLEDFTHMAGHNLRGPAANISGLVPLLRESGEAHLPQRLDLLQQAADGLMATLNELLKFSQVQLETGIPYDDCDIQAICAEALTEAAATDLQHDIHVTYDLAFPAIRYPRIYLQSIFYNLLSNAFKYRRTDVPLVITVKTALAGGRQKLTVADNGTGFDIEKNRDRIFKLNSTFHKGYSSKGIGLFITRAQVEKLGGEISVDSKPGEGTTFSILF